MTRKRTLAPWRKHTPGPWSHDDTWKLIRHGSTEIATLRYFNVANARLITAAPELLRTLRDLVALARDPDGCDFDADSLLSDAEILIARVTE